jgi:hypothetical protein
MGRTQRRFPGAAQHGAKRNDALQTRDRYKLEVCYDPGTAAHHYVLRRIRETTYNLAAQ